MILLDIYIYIYIFALLNQNHFVGICFHYLTRKTSVGGRNHAPVDKLFPPRKYLQTLHILSGAENPFHPQYQKTYVFTLGHAHSIFCFAGLLII